jgi:hypothetical protein
MGNHDPNLVGVGGHDSNQRYQRLPHVLASELVDGGELERTGTPSWRTQLGLFVVNKNLEFFLRVRTVALCEYLN